MTTFQIKMTHAPQIFWYLQTSNTTVVTISTIKRAKFHILVEILLKLANLVLIFIVQLTHAASNVRQLKNK